MGAMNEQRRSERRKTFMGGRLVYSQNFAAADCVVKNLGDEGARLTVRGDTAVPEKFCLEIPRLSISLPVRVAWRDGDGVGVAFVGEGRQRDPLDLVQRFRALRGRRPYPAVAAA
jgi:hypothetical protein